MQVVPSDRYDDMHEMHYMRHALTTMAHQINEAPASVLHEAPLLLR